MSAHLYALLVGINDYPHPSLPPLRGCVNDVEAMREVLVDDFGVPDGNVLVLPQEQATRAGIEAAFRDHLVAAGRSWFEQGPRDGPTPGFLFYFSGHGSQAEDPTGVEPDGLDETLVPYDGRDDDVYDIKDFELAAWLAELPGDDVTVVLDCCHSGSGTRARSALVGAARAAPRDVRPQPLRRPATLGATRGVSLEGGGSHVLLAACSHHQRAFEYHPADGVVRGRFSYFLVPQLAAAASDPDPTTYRDLHDRVWLDVAADARDQRPQCEGDLERVLFSAQRLERAAPAHVLGVRNGWVWTDVGRIHGVLPGSVLVAPTSHGAEVAIEVQRVEPVRCAGPPVTAPGLGPLPLELPQRGRRARIDRLELGPARWRLHTDAAAEPPLGSATVDGALTGLVTLVPDAASADLHVRRHGGELVLADADGRELVAAADDTFVAAVAHVARYAWLSTLERDELGPDLPGQVTLRPLTIGADSFSGETTTTALPQRGGGSYEVVAGQRLAFELRNDTRFPLQVGIVAFTAAWDIVVLHPAVRGAQDLLGSGRSITIGRDDTTFEAGLAEGHHRAVERLRLIATTHPTSLEPLAARAPTARWRQARALPAPAAGRPQPPSEPLLPRQGRKLPSRWLSASLELEIHR